MHDTAVLEWLRFGDHLCLPIRRAAEQDSLATAFTRIGLGRGDKVFLVVADPDRLRRHLTAWLPAATAGFATGQLEVVDSWQTYLGGGFHSDRIIEQFMATVDAAERDGYPGIRIIGDLSGVSSVVDAQVLVDYEARANTIYAARNALGLCQYHPQTLDDGAWRRMMAVHPGAFAAWDAEPISRLRSRPTDAGVRLSGEVDVVNRQALPQLLRAAEQRPGPCEIDATGLEFADGGAIAGLLRTAAARGQRPTTIVCRSGLAALLATLGGDGLPNLTVTVREGQHDR